MTSQIPERVSGTHQGSMDLTLRTAGLTRRAMVPRVETQHAEYPGSPHKHCWWHRSPHWGAALWRFDNGCMLPHCLSSPKGNISLITPQWTLQCGTCWTQHSILGLISQESSGMIPPIPNLIFVNNQNLRSTVEKLSGKLRKVGEAIILSSWQSLLGCGQGWPQTMSFHSEFTSDENPQGFFCPTSAKPRHPGPF